MNNRIALSVTLSLSLLLSVYGQKAYDHFLIVGTYTGGKSEGIYVLRFDTATAATLSVSVAKRIENPSFLCVDKAGKYIYAVSEKNNGQTPAGEIVAYEFINPSGILIEQQRISSAGNDPCYIDIHPSGQWLAAGNYSSGNFAIFSTLDAERPFEPGQVVRHTGSGIRADRQEASHVHATVFSPDGQYLLVPDLGTDKLYVYRFEASSSAISWGKNQTAKSVPGSGPRHIDFHPNGRWVYLMEELSSTVAVYRFRQGRLKFMQRISALPDDYRGERSSADIHVSPDGRFLYCSNRGDANSISIFSIQPNGHLTWIGQQSTLGIKPRNFGIAPGGNFLLVANQSSDQIAVFRIDRTHGWLMDTGMKIDVPSPVCLKWVRANL